MDSGWAFRVTSNLVRWSLSLLTDWLGTDHSIGLFSIMFKKSGVSLVLNVMSKLLKHLQEGTKELQWIILAINIILYGPVGISSDNQTRKHHDSNEMHSTEEFLPPVCQSFPG